MSILLVPPAVAMIFGGTLVWWTACVVVAAYQNVSGLIRTANR